MGFPSHGRFPFLPTQSLRQPQKTPYCRGGRQSLKMLSDILAWFSREQSLRQRRGCWWFLWEVNPSNRREEWGEGGGEGGNASKECVLSLGAGFFQGLPCPWLIGPGIGVAINSLCLQAEFLQCREGLGTSSGGKNGLLQLDSISTGKSELTWNFVPQLPLKLEMGPGHVMAPVAPATKDLS